jgi:hypothetical protein
MDEQRGRRRRPLRLDEIVIVRRAARTAAHSSLHDEAWWPDVAGSLLRIWPGLGRQARGVFSCTAWRGCRRQADVPVRVGDQHVGRGRELKGDARVVGARHHVAPRGALATGADGRPAENRRRAKRRADTGLQKSAARRTFARRAGSALSAGPALPGVAARPVGGLAPAIVANSGPVGSEAVFVADVGDAVSRCAPARIRAGPQTDLRRADVRVGAKRPAAGRPGKRRAAYTLSGPPNRVAHPLGDRDPNASRRHICGHPQPATTNLLLSYDQRRSCQVVCLTTHFRPSQDRRDPPDGSALPRYLSASKEAATVRNGPVPRH